MRVIALDIHRGFGEVAVHEDGIVRAGGVAPPGSKAGSRMEGRRWNMRGPTGAAGLVAGGGRAQGMTGAPVRAEVGSRTGS